MDTIFFDMEDDEYYKLAVLDVKNVFGMTDPGVLAIPFVCSKKFPKKEDDHKIFSMLAPSIKANDFFCDLEDFYKTQKLNAWSMDFFSVLDYEKRVELYSVRHSITPTTEEIMKDQLSLLKTFGKNLFDKNLFYWKNGILQRCIDSLVLLEYRGNPEMYATIDIEYRKIMRFKVETENIELNDPKTEILRILINKIVGIIGIRNTHDETSIMKKFVGESVFSNANEILENYIDKIETIFPKMKKDGNIIQKISNIFYMWSGSKINDLNVIEVDPMVKKGLAFMKLYW
jgi:hypothetical protein